MNETMRQFWVAVLTALGKPDSVLMGLIRHAVSGAGLLLVNSGLADENLVTTLEGAVFVLIGGGWSIVGKYITERWLTVSRLIPTPAVVDPVMMRAELVAVVAELPKGPVTKEDVATATRVVKADAREALKGVK